MTSSACHRLNECDPFPALKKSQAEKEGQNIKHCEGHMEVTKDDLTNRANDIGEFCVCLTGRI